MAADGEVVPSGSRLPPDLLHLLCSELALRNDFGSLYNCAVSSKHIAGSGALVNLYRASHNAPVKGGGSNEALPLPEQELIVQKWSIMWRTILLSCLGETLFPYCRYLRVLDLRDVYELLDDDKFRGKIQQNFFSGSLAQFNITSQTRSKNRALRSSNLRETVAAIGDAIVKAAPMLEELTEPIVGEYNILSTALLRWSPDLSRLRSLELWDGKTLGDETVRNLLHAHCPHLNRINIYQWRGDDSDDHLAQFLLNMPPNTLEYFENIGECGIGIQTCMALNTHAKSLKSLALAVPDKGIDGLGFMKDCRAIEKLKLTDTRPPHSLAEWHKETLESMIEWLKGCTKIREISLTNFVSAADILTPVLNEEGIELEELQVNARDDCMYVLKDHQAFHAAIGLQTKLQSLLLKADPEPFVPESRNQLCESLCELRDLRYLKLTRSSDYFQDAQLQLLGDNLLNLEDLLVSGWLLSDHTLEKLSNLGNLKSVTFNGLSSFTADGLLEFIDKLGPGNRGLAISIDMGAVESALNGDEQDLVRDTLAAKVQGRFEYQLVRDPDVPEFDESDSD